MEALKECWLEVGLLFETEEIISSYKMGKLKDEIKEVIIRYMISFSKFFNETGIYFTGEDTDGFACEALTGIGEHIWAFDIAVIPSSLEHIYLNIPYEFKKQRIKDKDIYIRDIL